MSLASNMTDVFDDPICYENVKESADYILERIRFLPKIGIICGSGLGSIADQLTNSAVFQYEEIPNFPVSTVPGHAGRLLVGLLRGVPVVVMQGRFHSYEGYELWKTAMPVRVMKLLGVETLIATNAGGGLNKQFMVGNIMVLKDHINLPGFSCQHPLRGPNDERFGPRFFPANNLYSQEFRKMAKSVSVDLGLTHLVKEGVYAMIGGPNYETVAELKMLRMVGTDSVGMSTVPETLVAHHCGMRVFACSLITNMCIVDYDSDMVANHEEVIEAGKKSAEDLKEFVTEMVTRINRTLNNPVQN